MCCLFGYDELYLCGDFRLTMSDGTETMSCSDEGDTVDPCVGSVYVCVSVWMTDERDVAEVVKVSSDNSLTVEVFGHACW